MDVCSKESVEDSSVSMESYLTHFKLAGRFVNVFWCNYDLSPGPCPAVLI